MPETVYSYIRFSTPEQAKGNSKKRQQDAAEEFARERGLIYDSRNRIEDFGLSGYTGANLKKGALGKFLALVEEQKIQKGSWLVVEEIDRLTRANPLDAVDLLKKIIYGGIRIYTTSDRQEYSKETLSSNPWGLLKFVISSQLAHDESVKKSKRIAKAWKDKRASALQNKNRKITSRCPAWLSYDHETGEFVPLQDRVNLIRYFFETILTGRGKDALARELNEKHLEPWGKGKRKGKGWHASYIQKILNNRAVLGEFQPHTITNGKRSPSGPPIYDYYPSIITPDLYNRVQQKLATSRRTVGKRSLTVSNLFTGIAISGHTNATVHFVNKGNGKKGGKYLVSSAATMGMGERYCSWPYQQFETTFLNYVMDLDWQNVLGESQQHSVKAINTKHEIDELQQKLDYKTKELGNLINVITQGDMGDVPTLSAHARELEITKSDLETQLKQKQHELSSIQGIPPAFKSIEQTLKQVIDKRDDYQTRLRLREAIRDTIDTIVIYFQGINPEEQWFQERAINCPDYIRLMEDYKYNPLSIFTNYAPNASEPERFSYLKQQPNAPELIHRRIVKDFKPSGRCFIINFKNGAKRCIAPTKNDSNEHYAQSGGDLVSIKSIN